MNILIPLNLLKRHFILTVAFGLMIITMVKLGQSHSVMRQIVPLQFLVIMVLHRDGMKIHRILKKINLKINRYDKFFKALYIIYNAFYFQIVCQFIF